ncbi:type IV secretion protein Rhs [Vibrio cincinnatiensis]|uniref:RHS repeat-associated core domain-containing protein n=2 Tax=Vibrio cincinnatiensis TaxID=675 RepID=UPI001EDEF951|nr:RHS repeat-associated core domain-containing protein [Vibrio cincinnatiensis]MCG3761997.1 type IV secretion protein Rhs [Vibrio cincinnatiensis]
MSIQRIVRLAAYDGSLHYFSDQPIAEGKACDFPTIALATQFLERFKLSDLADIEELARWIGAEPIVNVHREKNTFADYLAPLSQALVHRHLHVVQIASVNPTGGLPAAPISPPKAKPSKPTSDGKSEEMRGEDRVSQESHPESSKNHETAGDPVSMVTGEEILTLTDITRHHGLVFSRTYRSSRCDSDTGLGYGWRHNFDFQLLDIACDKGSVTHWQFIDEMGDAISFPAVNKGAVSYQIYVGASCFYQETGYALVTLASGAQYKFERIEGAWLLKQIRPNILTLVTLDYSSKYRLIGVSFNQCHCFELQYDQRGHLIEIREPHSGRVFSRYRYDPQDCLISATNQQGQTEHYEYTDAHLILRRRRNTGFNHYFEWLGEGSGAQCVRNYGDEQVYDYCFQYSEHNSSFTDTLGHQWTFRHSDEGQLLEKQSPEGRLWRWDYNPLGKLVTEHFPDGSFMRYQYNAYGQRCAQHHSSGATTHYQYNPLGQLTMVEYPDGEKQHQHYNSLGQLLWRSEPEGSVTHYQYDKFGRLIQSQSEHGEQCQWWWNEAEQLIAQQTNQTLLRYSYDESHHLNGIAYPDGMLLALEYDERGQRIQTRLYSERDEHQREVRYHYDDFGRITQVVTPAGCSIIEWSKLAQPEALLRPDGAGLAFDYDGERNLTALTRSDGASYHFTLSEEGHLTQTRHFDGTVTDYQYDAAGRLSHLTCDKRQVLFHYDLRGNLTLIRAGGESGVSEHHFQFSAGDKLCLASNTHRTVSYHYQPNGLLSEQTQGLHALAYRYHSHGQLSDIHLPSGETVKFDYTPYGQLSAVSLSGQSVPLIEYEYDVMGRLYRLRYANQQEEKQFDGIGRLCQQRWSGRERKYYFDGAQYLAIIMDSEAGTTHYHYDAVGQLTRVTTRKREEKYQYDPFGNPSDAQSQCSGDKLLEHGGWRYQYDAQGNQSQAEGEGQAQHRRFNALNQLVAVENNGGLSHYEYDALGRRSRKITEAGVTEFIWHESQLIGEYHQGRYRWYVYQPDSHIPALLLEDGQYYVYQCDHLGSPLRLVTPEGDVVWQAHYETWGEAQIEIERVVNPLRFQGQYYDAETGLHYNLARYYDPRTGRFIQPDPIGLLGGLNHYQYAPNPVMWIDPTGLCAKEDSTLPVDALAENPQQTLITSTLPASYQPTTLASSPVGRWYEEDTDSPPNVKVVAEDTKPSLVPYVGEHLFKQLHLDGHPKDPYTLMEDGLPKGAKEGPMPEHAKGLTKFPEELLPLLKEGYPDVLGREDFENFSDIEPKHLPPGTKIFRIIDEDSSEARGESGCYWALSLPEGKVAWRSNYAVKDSWNDNGYYVEHIVGDEGLKVWQGKTAGQEYECHNEKEFYLEGGETQLYVGYNTLPNLKPALTNWKDA